MNEPFLKALPILRKIETCGFEAYFVGGSIRDYLLKRQIDDVDIATSANPDEIKEIFNRTVDIGIEHGTILVLYENESYEITTFRSESQYKDYRHPDNVEFIRSLTRDLERRDFTMNAIAMNQYGELKDPFNGRDDIFKKTIRTVGNPSDRFREDALRMMRAIRFVSQLGFSIDQNTEMALCQYAELLQYISTERITTEFIKLFKGEYKKNAITLLIQSNLVNYIPVAIKTKTSLQQCIHFQIDPLTENQLWLIVLYFIQDDPSSFLKKWRLPNQKVKYLTKCLTVLKERDNHSWTLISLYHLTIGMALDIETVHRTLYKKNIGNIQKEIANKFAEMIIKSRDELAVTGTDLINWYKRPGGPWIKNALDRIEEAVLLKEVENEKDAIKGWSFNHAVTYENEND
jgi:tRNA nucleotidyltransferase (CCA-adding enzyme)